MTALVEIRGLTKVYARDVRANDGIDLDVNRGEVLGLLGHNGAGKTTLVRQIIGLSRPSAGTIQVDGVDAVAQPAVVRGLCSLQAQAQVPITGLTPRQAISLIGRLRGGRRHAVDRRMLQLAERLQILDWLDKPARAGDDELTGGVRRLFSFCMAAVRPGKLAVLDEPTNDVDPVRRRLLWAEIRRLADDGCAVIVVTHNVSEAEHWVDRAAILHRGRVIACGRPEDLAAGMLGRLRVEIGWHGSVPALPHAIAPPPAGTRRLVQTIGREWLTDVMSWGEAMRSRGLLEQFAVRPASLEDAYGVITEAADDRASSDGPTAPEPAALGAPGGVAPASPTALEQIGGAHAIPA